MIMTNRLKSKLSSQVFSQVPEFIRTDYPLFIKFLESYYEFMEQDKKSQEILQNIKQYGDVDKTIEELLPKFFDQYAQGFPYADAITADEKLFIKRIGDLYASKGTEKGYEFLFRILYNETIDFYYPSSEILRTSDGKWVRTFTMACYRDGNSDPFELENTVIVGDRSGATGTVNHVIRYYSGEGQEVFELTLDPISVKRTFSSFERIRARKLIRLDGSNKSTANVRKNLSASEVYPYYLARPNEFQGILFEDGASEEVARRRIANLAKLYGWTEAELITIYNEVFPIPLTTEQWRSINPLVNHPASLNTSNSYQYYLDNPTEFASLLRANNATENTIIERILTTAREFNWTADELVATANKALARSYIPNEWAGLLLSESAVYKEVTAFLYPMLAEIDIVSPGVGYLPGDVVEVSNIGGGSGALAEVLAVSPVGGIINVRVLESGVNYRTTTVLTPKKSANNRLTARQILRNNVATVYFDRDHGLSVGDQITVTDTNALEPTGDNLQYYSIHAAGNNAVIAKHGIFDQQTGNAIFIGNATHTVSIYNTDAQTFVEHTSYDLEGTANSNVIDETTTAGYAANISNWTPQTSKQVYNLANVFTGESNVHVVSGQLALSKDDLPEHSRIRLRALVHMVENWQGETVNVSLEYDAGDYNTSWTKTAVSGAQTVTAPSEGSITYVGKQNYDGTPFFGSIVMDTTKPADFTLESNVYVTARTNITGLVQPPSIIQSNVFVFGQSPDDDLNKTSNIRILQRTEKFNLEGVSTLYYNVNPGLTGTWGEDPVFGEFLKFEYSLDGDNWTELDSVSDGLIPKGSWTQRIVSVPEQARTATYLRFYQELNSGETEGPLDTFAITSVVTEYSAVSVDNGYMVYDSGWLTHTSDTIDVNFTTTLPSTSQANLYVSNVIVDVSTDQTTLMINKLNSTTVDDLVIVHTWEDAGVSQRNDVDLVDAMLRIGATVDGWQTNLDKESAYILIGSPNHANIGGALEYYASFGDFSASNYIGANIKLDSGNIQGPSFSVGSIPTDRTIQYTKQGDDSNSNVYVYLESGATLRPNIGALVISDPFWKNNDGRLSENMFVQGRSRTATEDDPIYYQQFSYVIRSEHPINEWRQYAYDVMHPAGFALFNELKLQTMPESVVNMSPVAIFPAEIQDFFAITADKAQRTHPQSPDFRADMTVFPPASAFNPKILNMNTAHAVSSSTMGSDYVTVQCLFRKSGEETPGGFSPLFSKWLSWEVSTTGNILTYRVMRQNFRWINISTGVPIELNKTYLITLTYDGSAARLYLNGTLKSTSDNARLGLTTNNSPGVLANQNTHPVQLNSSGADTTVLNNSALSKHSFIAFDVYDRALSSIEVTQNWLHYKDTFYL